MSEQPQQLDRKDLKILAYKEENSRLVEQVADLRVEVTVLGQQLQETVNALQSAAQKEDELVEEIVDEVSPESDED